jgi:hypothetical protein
MQKKGVLLPEITFVYGLTLLWCSPKPLLHSLRVLNNRSAGTSWDITTNGEQGE